MRSINTEEVLLAGTMPFVPNPPKAPLFYEEMV